MIFARFLIKDCANTHIQKLTMQWKTIGRMGAWLYRTGWNHSSRRNLSLIQHLFLSMFYYYRQGFHQAARYKREVFLDRMRQESHPTLPT